MIRCHRDENGINWAEPVGVHPLVATYLEDDIQGSPESARRVLTILDDVESGKLGEWVGTGNAHTLTVRRAGVGIENVWDESLGAAAVSLKVFRECVEAWLAFISGTEAARQVS